MNPKTLQTAKNEAIRFLFFAERLAYHRGFIRCIGWLCSHLTGQQKKMIIFSFI